MQESSHTLSSTFFSPSETQQNKNVKLIEISPTTRSQNAKTNVSNSKTVTSKSVYEGLAILNDKKLLYEIKLKKAKMELETSKLENSLMVKKITYKSDKLESKICQNKIKEEILLLELTQKKIWIGLAINIKILVINQICKCIIKKFITICILVF